MKQFYPICYKKLYKLFLVITEIYVEYFASYIYFTMHLYGEYFAEIDWNITIGNTNS